MKVGTFSQEGEGESLGVVVETSGALRVLNVNRLRRKAPERIPFPGDMR